MWKATDDTAAIYSRRSKDLDQLGKNVASQVRDMQDLANRHGHTVTDTHVYVDNDVSASRFSKKQRTEWKQLRAAIERGEVTHVYTLWLNRLLRVPGELEWLIDQALSGTFQSIITESMSLDLRDPYQQMMARQMASQADLEVQQLSARVKRRKQEDRTEGKATGGVVSFGWLGTRHGHANDDGDTLHAAEAAMLHDAGMRVLAGTSLSAIAREWNQQRVQMPLAWHQAVKAGTNVEDLPAPKWMPGHIARLLQMPRNAGYQTHEGVICGQPWPAIFADAEWQQLQQHFAARKLGTRAARSGHWTGFVRCAVCGRTMGYTPAKGTRPGGFKCTQTVGRDSCPVAVSVVERHVVDAAHAWLPDYLDSDAVAAMVADDDDGSEATYAELQKLNAVQENMDVMLGTGQVEPQMYARASQANKARREELQRTLVRQPVRNVVGQYLGRGNFVATLLADGVLEADEHRALFASTGMFLWVAPANGHKAWNPARLTFSDTKPEWTQNVHDNQQEVA